MTEVKIRDHRRTIIRSLIVWLLIIVAEIVHGILRAIALVPALGEFRSNQIGVFTGSAIILVISYVLATFFFHDFWTFDDQEQQMQMIQFMKNLSLMGTMVFLMAIGAVQLSLDAKLAVPKSE